MKMWFVPLEQAKNSVSQLIAPSWRAVWALVDLTEVEPPRYTFSG